MVLDNGSLTNYGKYSILNDSLMNMYTRNNVSYYHNYKYTFTSSSVLVLTLIKAYESDYYTCGGATVWTFHKE